MPYKSEAQRKYFNANRKELESQGVDVDEWNQASKGKKLPEKAEDKEKKSSVFNQHGVKPVTTKLASLIAHRILSIKKAQDAIATLRNNLNKEARCWKGYEPVPGKKAYSDGSCRPVGSGKKEEKKANAGGGKLLSRALTLLGLGSGSLTGGLYGHDLGKTIGTSSGLTAGSQAGELTGNRAGYQAAMEDVRKQALQQLFRGMHEVMDRGARSTASEEQLRELPYWKKIPELLNNRFAPGTAKQANASGALGRLGSLAKLLAMPTAAFGAGSLAGGIPGYEIGRSSTYQPNYDVGFNTTYKDAFRKAHEATSREEGKNYIMQLYKGLERLMEEGGKSDVDVSSYLKPMLKTEPKVVPLNKKAGISDVGKEILDQHHVTNSLFNTGAGASLGALGGGLHGLINPGETTSRDEEGNEVKKKRSRIMGALRGAGAGLGIGAGIGGLTGGLRYATDPTYEAIDMLKQFGL